MGIARRSPTDRDQHAEAGEPDAIRRALEGLRGPGRVHVGPGEHVVTAPILLRTGVSLIGAGTDRSRITLAPGSNCHIVTNADQERGNKDIELRDLTLAGSMRSQERPSGHTGTTFACGAYFKGVRHLRISGVDAYEVRQSAFHFSECTQVELDRSTVDKVGWSGVSTSATDALVVRDMRITASGLDDRHSAIHLDGGTGAHLEGVVIERSSGNGFMLGSKFAPLRDVVVRGAASQAMRGVALFGQNGHALENVLVSGTFLANRECGILVFNASNVFIIDATIDADGQPGIVLEGPAGVDHCVVVGCRLMGTSDPIVGRDGSRPAYVADTTAEGGAVEVEPLRTPRRSPRTAPTRSVRSRIRSVARRALRSRAPKRHDSGGDDSFDGTCSVCGTSQTFFRGHAAIREGYRCLSCQASLRYQGQAGELVRTYATEGATHLAALVEESRFRSMDVWEPGVLGPFRSHLSHLPGYVTSDFRPDIPRGEEDGGIRCEDITALTFADESFDLVVTSDIFEHVRIPEVGFREVHRVLRPGGRHVFSIPIQQPWRTTTQPLVDTSGPDDVYLVPPQYHLGPNKSLHLVYNEFGQDLLDLLRRIGFDTEVTAFSCSSPDASRLLTLSSLRR